MIISCLVILATTWNCFNSNLLRLVNCLICWTWHVHFNYRYVSIISWINQNQEARSSIIQDPNNRASWCMCGTQQCASSSCFMGLYCWCTWIVKPLPLLSSFHLATLLRWVHRFLPLKLISWWRMFCLWYRTWSIIFPENCSHLTIRVPLMVWPDRMGWPVRNLGQC